MRLRLSQSFSDPSSLVEQVLSVCTNPDSDCHGPHHWLCVGETGRWMLEHSSEADPLVVFLFALFHDSMRVNDHSDPGHGTRGAQLAARMRAQGLFAASNQQMEQLRFACDRHTDGMVTDQITPAICWDSDRLNLWRVGVKPDPFYLSHPLAPQLIEPALELQQQSLSWEQLHQRYLLLPQA